MVTPPPHAPLGVITKIGRWFADFVTMPSRVRELAKGAMVAADGRLPCRTCGVGRVGYVGLYKEEGSAINRPLGRCDPCGQEWIMDHTCKEILRPKTGH